MARKITFSLEVEKANLLINDLSKIELKLKSLNKEVRQTEKEIDIFNKGTKEQRAALQASGKSVTQLESKYRTLKAKQVDLRAERTKTNKSIREERKEYDALKAGLPTDSINGLRLAEKKLREEFNKLSGAQRNSKFGRQIQKDAAATRKEINRLSASVNDYRGNVGNYLSVSKKFGSALTGALGIGLAGGGAVAFGRVLSEASDIIIDFDEAVTNLGAISGATDRELSSLRETAKSLGGTTAFTATQVAELQTELAKLGFATEEIISAQEVVINFSVATRSSVPEAAALAGAVIRSFGLDVADAEKVLASLAVATTKSALDFSKLSTALPIVSAAAKAQNITLENTTALLGTLADRGIDASSAATALRNIFLRSAKAGVPYQELLQKVSDSANKSATAVELFGVRLVIAGLVLADAADDVETLEGAITGVDDQLKELADKQLESVRGKITLLKSAYSGFILSVEDGTGRISKAVKATVEVITNGFESLTLFNEGDLSFFDLLSTAGNPAGRVRLQAKKIGIAAAKGIEDGVREQNEKAREKTSSILGELTTDATGAPSFTNDGGKGNLEDDIKKVQQAIEKAGEVAEETGPKIKKGLTINKDTILFYENLISGFNQAIRNSTGEVQGETLEKLVEAEAALTLLEQRLEFAKQSLQGELFGFDENIEEFDFGDSDRDEEQSLVEAASKELEIYKKTADEKLQIEKENQKAIDKAKQDALDADARYAQASSAIYENAFNSLGDSLGSFVTDVTEDSEEAFKNLAKNILGTVIELIGQQAALLITTQAATSPDPATALTKTAITSGIVIAATKTLKAALINSFEYGGVQEYAAGGKQQFKKGAISRGRSHQNGGVPVWFGDMLSEIEANEAIINGRSTDMFRDLLSAINEFGGGRKFGGSSAKYMPLLSMISKRQFADGGLSTSPTFVTDRTFQGASQAVISKEALEALGEQIKDSQEQLIDKAVVKIVDRMIVGLDSANRSNERNIISEQAGLA